MLNYSTLSGGIILALYAPLIDSCALLALSSVVLIWVGGAYSRIRCNLLIEQNLARVALALSLFVFGYSYASLRSNYQSRTIIHENVPSLLISGCLAAPPSSSTKQHSAEFKLNHNWLGLDKILLSYPESSQLLAGHSYLLAANLTPLKSMSNYAAFDYQQYLLTQNIHAQGQLVRVIEDAGMDWGILCQVNRLRVNLIDYLSGALREQRYAGLIIALVSGYQGMIPAEQWTLFKNSGIIHIVSVSGLHITVLAGLFVMLLNQILLRLNLFSWPRQISLAWGALVIAGGYALLAGFNVPAQRTFYLLLITCYLQTNRLYLPLLTKLSLTLAIVLIIDPWAAQGLGFWFSFGLVAIIFSTSALYSTHSSKLRLWLKLQLATTLLSLALSLYWFASYPLGATLANLWAIPIIGDILTPVLLISSLLHLTKLLQLSATLLDYAMHPIIWCAKIPNYTQAIPSLAAMLISLSGLGVLLLPLPHKFKNFLGALLFAALLLPATEKRPPYAELKIIAFANPNLGAALLTTRYHHVLILSIPPSETIKISAELERSIMPYLHSQHIQRLDYLLSDQQLLLSQEWLRTQKLTIGKLFAEGKSELDGVKFDNLTQNRRLSLGIDSAKHQNLYCWRQSSA